MDNSSFSPASEAAADPFVDPNLPLTDKPAAFSAYSNFKPQAPTPAEFYRASRAFDEARPSFAGEHAMVCASGLSLLALARYARPGDLRCLVAALGIGLLARSASGRDGYLQKAKDALK